MSADPCSFSSINSCLTKHLNLCLNVDFTKRVLKGRATLTLEALEDRFSVLTLDTRDLKIISVSANGQEASFTLGSKHSFKGTPLEIRLPFDISRGQHVIVEVKYETSPSATALQWLTPEQTAGKKYPYLFSQCQVSVPKDLVAVMSAVRDGHEMDPQDSERIVYRFRQPTEQMLQTAEKLAGPYVWGQYDILVLPPSFPYGGMENPCLTFATPTLLVNTFGPNSPLTNLVPSLQDVDPDDAFSSVPYEKGFALLYHLEELMGGPASPSLVPGLWRASVPPDPAPPDSPAAAALQQRHKCVLCSTTSSISSKINRSSSSSGPPFR
ncbi:hypothetical protein NQD34_018343 [Periophthalmus magnuspinnatus]|nr:hypothetical protein NQD34_018343 [Periophthalmus magnuspinnatus]